MHCRISVLLVSYLQQKLFTYWKLLVHSPLFRINVISGVINFECTDVSVETGIDPESLLVKRDDAYAATEMTTGWCSDTSGGYVVHVNAISLPYSDGLTTVIESYAGDIGVQITATPIGEAIYALDIVSPHSAFDAVSVLLTLCVLQVTNRDVRPEDHVLSPITLQQYVAILNASKAPYFIRYLFSRNAIKTEADFQALKPALETVGIDLNFSHSQRHRYDAIAPCFPGGDVMVDIGCGNGYYLRRLAPRYKSVIGFEADGPTRKEAGWQMKIKGLTRVCLSGAFDSEAYIPSGAHVLMTEVLEHMPKATARAMLMLLSFQPAAQMVFTVPNHAFNRHYNLADGAFRHWDHQWEPDAAEFSDLMKSVFGKAWNVEIYGIGDAVDDVYSGGLCRVTRKTPATMSFF